MLVSAVALVEEIRRFRLLPPSALDELTSRLQAQFSEPRDLARELVRRGWLTPFQVNQLFLGRGSGLVFGQYVLLERLGEGGMGQVFKARHQALGRIVAVKILRKEQTANVEATRRFEREVQAAAQVSHPNIVLAFDANRVEDCHFLVMEYVEGIDLRRLVKQSGPLPVAEACDYIRQAALGLQHAHECGLVHRDIKPSNLLLTPAPPAPVPPGKPGRTVKLLDLGVARVQQQLEEVTTLTQFGMVMGTPDYIAPEQARNAHLADIRADLYSLGCTFYYLLTAQAPFPGGSLTEKLLRHQMDEPPPLEALRPEVTPAVVAVVKKLMAKDPRDRYQTPAEVVTALTSIAATSAKPAVVHTAASSGADSSTTASETTTRPTSELTREGAERTDSTDIVWSSVLSTVETARPSTVRRLRGRDLRRTWSRLTEKGRWRWLAAGTAGVSVALLLALILILFPRGARDEKANETATVRRQIEAHRPWQDTGVDVVAGTAVTIRASGIWHKAQAGCSADGFPGASRERAVLADAALMCLLARIGREGTPLAVGKERQLVPQRSGRLFLRTNDLDLEGNRGRLDVEIEGVVVPGEGK